jgi:spore coat polysaccharide biosynthesis protein SpsF
MRVSIVIQARTASTRLPGKVLLPLGGKPMLERMLQRVAAARQATHIVVATTTLAVDEPIVKLSARLGVRCVRGDSEDCLSRHLAAAAESGADAVAKIPSDCPLIDPQGIDRVLSIWHASEGRFDYLSNLHPPSWPDGNDIEVMSLAALRTAGNEATDAFDREHTTPFLWSQPDRFRLGNVLWETGLDHSRTRRWVVDWPEDYELVKAIYDRLAPKHGACFGVQSVLRLLERQPELLAINARHLGYDYAASRLKPPSLSGSSAPSAKEKTS